MSHLNLSDNFIFSQEGKINETKASHCVNFPMKKSLKNLAENGSTEKPMKALGTEKKGKIFGLEKRKSRPCLLFYLLLILLLGLYIAHIKVDIGTLCSTRQLDKGELH
jgi:hypothetical protein